MSNRIGLALKPLETSRSRPWIGVLVAVALGGAVYAPMLGAGYVWDDGIYLDRQLPFFHGIRDAFYPPVGMMQGFVSHYYRPLIPLSSILDQILSGHPGGGTPAAWSHGANIFYHLAVTSLVYLLAFTILRNAPRRALAATAAAVVFAVHPIHAEVVCSISGRTDLLATLLVIASFLAAFVARGRAGLWIGVALSAALFFLGLLAKETAVALLVLIPAGIWLFPVPEGAPPRRTGFAARVLLAALLLTALAVYLKLRATAGFNFGSASTLGVEETLRATVAALGYYIRKVLIPWPQLHYVVRLPAVLPAALSLAAVAIAALWFFRVSRRSRPILGFCLIWFAVCLAPALAVVVRPLSVNPVAERYLYLPSVALSLGVAHWIAVADFRRFSHRAGVAGLAVLLLAYGASTVERTSVWQDNIRFWSDALRDPGAAGSPIVHANYAGAIQGEGRIDEARRHLRKAYALFTNPVDRMRVLVNLAVIDRNAAAASLALGNWAQAEAQAADAILNLEPPLASELRFDDQVNAAMGAALLIKAQAQARRTGAPPDPTQLNRALRHLDLALYGRPGDANSLEYRALCQRLLAPAPWR